VFPLLAACSVESSGGGTEPERGSLGKADLFGTCEWKGKEFCGKHGKGNCWCDEACVDFGDCCSDADEVCGIEQPTLGEPCGGWIGDICSDGEYCKYDLEDICGWADASGVCETTPYACTKIYKPVCGCDGNTYGNACTAAAAGMSVQSEGVCPQKTCGGIAGIPCPPDQQCVDNPDDNCDPNNGGADCGGICVDKIQCGGFGGFPCPDDLVCIDDPDDDCDPNNGGADCGGICVPPKECEPVACNLFCEFGFAVDETGCEICECAPDPEQPACHVAGCSGELCVGPDGPDVSICIYQPWYECLELTKCGNYGVDGGCSWDPNEAFQACLDQFAQ
jgi:eight-cysteine-cluster-containing protein